MSDMEELVQSNEERLKRLAAEGVGLNLVPPRIEHLTNQVFNQTWDSVEAWELAWQEKVAEILDEVEPQVAKQKLLIKPAPTSKPKQLQLV